MFLSTSSVLQKPTAESSALLEKWLLTKFFLLVICNHMKITTFICPVCNLFLNSEDGDHLHPNNPDYGVTLFCPSFSCPAQEVFGHANNERNAFEIITQKYGKKS